MLEKFTGSIFMASLNKPISNKELKEIEEKLNSSTYFLIGKCDGEYKISILEPDIQIEERIAIDKEVNILICKAEKISKILNRDIEFGLYNESKEKYSGEFKVKDNIYNKIQQILNK